ncbi:MAG: hypothetical protein PVH68_06885 [Armatimonadota bacterium]|jgi:hypothetical protein
MGCPSDVKIGDDLVFTITTHDPDTGVVTDADSAPAYRVYEEETGTAILTGTMAKLDDANTTGFYSESIACTSANGFEDGKTYSVYVEATVDSDKGAISFGFAAHDHDCTDIQDDLDSDSVVVASVSGAVGSVTGAVGSVTGNVDGSVASVAGNVDGNVTGSVGDLTATAVAKVWDDLTSGLTQAGSIGKLIVDYLDAQVSLCALEATVAALNDLAVTDILSDSTAFPGASVTEVRLAELAAGNIPTDLSTIAAYVDTLETRLTAVRAGYLDNLSAGAAALEATLTDIKGATFDTATDSLEEIRDRGDAAWVTGGGGTGVNVMGVVSVPTLIDLANTATVRLSVHVLDTSDDLPTAGEITPGTVSIHRKARAGTSWSAVVTDAACSESAGLVYYDEVFDSGSGYALGDMIRVTFKGQAVVIGANTHEVFPAGGSTWYSRVTALNDTAGGHTYMVPIAVEAMPDEIDVEVEVVEP